MLSKIYRKFFEYAKKPSNFFRFRTLKVREFYYIVSEFMRPQVLRRRSINKFNTEANTGQEISSDLGYLKLNNFRDEDNLRCVINEARKDIFRHCNNVVKDQNKEYLQNVEFTNELSLNSPYIKLALNSEIISIVSKYLGVIPILSDIRLWHSPNDSDNFSGSQYFHLDWADIKQVKVFVLLEDTDKYSGPTTLVQADTSRKICDSIGYRLADDSNRVYDSVISKYVSEDQFIEVIGNQGDIFMADTSRCLHFGSRKGDKQRNILMLQYVTPFSFKYSLDFQSDTRFSYLISSENSPLNNLIFGSK